MFDCTSANKDATMYIIKGVDLLRIVEYSVNKKAAPHPKSPLKGPYLLFAFIPQPFPR